MISLFVALVVLLGAGGAVVVSDSARPGDLLFPIDRAVEDIRLVITPEESKADLKIKFANERLDEVDSLVSEEEDGDGDDDKTQGAEVSAEAQLRIEHALDILTALLVEVHGQASTSPEVSQAISVLEARLLERTTSLPEEISIKIRNDQGRIELRTEDDKFNDKDDDDLDSNATSTNSNDDDEDEDNDSDSDEDDPNTDDDSNSGSGSNSGSSNN